MIVDLANFLGQELGGIKGSRQELNVHVMMFLAANPPGYLA